MARRCPSSWTPPCAQDGGYRFVYTLPFDERPHAGRGHLLQRRARTGTRPRCGANIDAYIAGARLAGRSSVVREESGVLPIALSGDIERFWRDKPAQLACSGLRAGLFHATTGYSLPDAVRLADAIAALPAPVRRGATASRQVHRAQWRGQGFMRLLNRMLFFASAPASAIACCSASTPAAPLIERFYAARLTWSDKLRILTGKPPVPVGAARSHGHGQSSKPERNIIRASRDRQRIRRPGARDPPAGGRHARRLVLEQRDKPGGRAYVYEDQGFTFDAGPTVITDPTALRRAVRAGGPAHRRLRRAAAGHAVLPAVLGRRRPLRLRQRPGTRWTAQIARSSRRPTSAGYRRFLDYSQAVFDEGYVKLGARAVPATSATW